jgi:CRP-like cAMP-binding protein
MASIGRSISNGSPLSRVAPDGGPDADPKTPRTVRSTVSRVEMMKQASSFMSAKKTQMKATAAVAGDMVANSTFRKVKRKFSLGGNNDDDVDKSDVNTRSKHEIVKRSDGTEAIVTLRSSSDVVKKFKLRSNSVVDISNGSLLFVDMEAENKLLEKEAREKHLITDSNKWLQRWRAFMLVAILSQVIFAPINWAFKPTMSAPVMLLDNVVDGFFFVDFLMQFQIATVDAQGHIITSRLDNLYHYIVNGRFFYDLVTCVPLDKFVSLSLGNSQLQHNNATLTQLNRFTRIARFRRLTSFYHLLSYMDLTKQSWFFYSAFSQYAKLLSYIVGLSVFINYFGCFWYSVAWIASLSMHNSTETEAIEVETGFGWSYWEKHRVCSSKYFYNDYVSDVLEDEGTYTIDGQLRYLYNSSLSNMTLGQTTQQCMDSSAVFDSEYIWSNYVTSILAALQLLMTGENLVPVTTYEKIVQSGYLLIGTGTIAFTFGAVHSIVSNINSRSSAYQNKIESIYDAMEKMKLPDHLSERIFYYYDYIHMEHGTLDGNVDGFLPEVTKRLQAEIYLWQRYQLIIGVPFFMNINPKIIQDIVVKLQVEVYLPGDFVITKGDFGDTMYFIYTGQCQVMVPMSTSEIVAKKATKAAADGEGYNRARRKSSVSVEAIMAAVKGIKEGKKPDDEDDDDDDVDDDEEEDSSVRNGEANSGLHGRKAPQGRVQVRASAKFNAKVSRVKDPVEKQRRNSIGSEQKRRNSIGGAQEVQRLTVAHKIVATLNAGQYFGEVALILQSKRTASIKSKGISEMCVLTKTVYDLVASMYPEDAELMKTSIMSKYGSLNHAEEVRKSVFAVGGGGRQDPSTPSRGLQAQGSSTMTMRTEISTPSDDRNLSREGSWINKSVPISPTHDFKKAVDDFRGHMNLVNFAGDKLMAEERDARKQLDMLEEFVMDYAKAAMLEEQSESDKDSDDEDDDGDSSDKGGSDEDADGGRGV